MMSIHLEVKFEDEICDYLSRSGWIYEKDAANKYNKDLALFPSDLIEWLKESQIEAWQTLEKKHKSRTEDVLIDGVRLAKLMIEHCVGVQVKETIRVAKIDQDFFSGED